MSDQDDPNGPRDNDGSPSPESEEKLRDRVRAAERSGLEALEAGDFEAASEFLLDAVGGYEQLGDPKSTNSAAYYLGVSLDLVIEYLILEILNMGRLIRQLVSILLGALVIPHLALKKVLSLK
jgi:hypothetical protein